jgi:FMN phosphatase YigB (HAD superfamily)
MGIKFIFDLDMTLYSKFDFRQYAVEDKYYNSFKQKHFLHSILSRLPYDKFILTNATKDHAIDVSKRIGIAKDIPESRIFSIDMADPSMRIMKPDPIMYHMALKKFGITPEDTIYYFEDMVENLQPVKKLYKNWTTIWICPDKESRKRFPKYVDFVYPSIEAALLEISSRLLSVKKNTASIQETTKPRFTAIATTDIPKTIKEDIKG